MHFGFRTIHIFFSLRCYTIVVVTWLNSKNSLLEFRFHLKIVFISKNKYIDNKAQPYSHWISSIKCFYPLKMYLSVAYYDPTMYYMLCIAVWRKKYRPVVKAGNKLIKKYLIWGGNKCYKEK